ADYSTPVPDELVEITIRVPVIAVEKGFVRLLHQQMITLRLTVDPKPNVLGQFRGHFCKTVHFVCQRLRQDESRRSLENDVDTGHSPQGLVLEKMHLVSAPPARCLDEVERL